VGIKGNTVATIDSIFSNAPVESAVLTVAIDVFKARTSAGSVQQGLDFVPQPYILGRTIQNRIIGMLGAYIDVEALIG